MHFEIVSSPTVMETILRQEEGKSANSCPHCDMVTAGFIFNLCSQFNREEEQKGWRKSLDRSQEWLNSLFLAVVGGEFISKQESWCHLGQGQEKSKFFQSIYPPPILPAQLQGVSAATET